MFGTTCIKAELWYTWDQKLFTIHHREEEYLSLKMEISGHKIFQVFIAVDIAAYGSCGSYMLTHCGPLYGDIYLGQQWLR